MCGDSGTDCAQSKFEVFQREMTAHLDEEEREVVPAMRRTFKQQEERKVRPSWHRHASRADDRQSIRKVLCGRMPRQRQQEAGPCMRRPLTITRAALC